VFFEITVADQGQRSPGKCAKFHQPGDVAGLGVVDNHDEHVGGVGAEFLSDGGIKPPRLVDPQLATGPDVGLEVATVGECFLEIALLHAERFFQSG
jgi:hypothetical protein